MNDLDKKILKGILLFGLAAVTGWVIWLNLPFGINRYADIQLGNRIIANIESYKRVKGLPDSNDWETLRTLGFRDKVDFLEPNYQKINENTFELVFLEGFDGPYLLWNSKERTWKKDFPAIHH